jgi:transposase
LKLTDSGFDYSVLSGFRERLADGEKQALLLDRMLELLRQKKLLKARGKQHTDSTHVLAAIRVTSKNKFWGHLYL